MLLSCRLDLICLLESTLSSITTPYPHARDPLNLCAKFFEKIVQLWGAIAPKRGQNSKIWDMIKQFPLFCVKFSEKVYCQMYMPASTVRPEIHLF